MSTLVSQSDLDLLAAGTTVTMSFGAGADLDAAFDEAVAAAGDAHGFSGSTFSIASHGGTPHPLELDQPLPALAAARHAVLSAQDQPGQLVAVPVTARSAFSFRRARVVLTEADLAAGEQVGDVEPVLAALAGEGAWQLQSAEVPDSVSVNVRASHRPVWLKLTGKAHATFVVLDPACAQILSTGHPTETKARGWATAYLRAMDKDNLERPTLHVLKLVGREGGLPRSQVTRTRVRARTTIKLTLATFKGVARPRVVGWVFAASPEQDTPAPLPDDSPRGDQPTEPRPPAQADAERPEAVVDLTETTPERELAGAR